jgi:hypothetical protein
MRGVYDTIPGGTTYAGEHRQSASQLLLAWRRQGGLRVVKTTHRTGQIALPAVVVSASLVTADGTAKPHTRTSRLQEKS